MAERITPGQVEGEPGAPWDAAGVGGEPGSGVTPAWDGPGRRGSDGAARPERDGAWRRERLAASRARKRELLSSEPSAPGSEGRSWPSSLSTLAQG